MADHAECDLPAADLQDPDLACEVSAVASCMSFVPGMVAHRADLTLATPLGSGPQAGPVLLELLSQPVVFVGLSHFLVAGRYIGEPVEPRLGKPDGQAAGREAYRWLQRAIEQ